jgi:hypothetical protein
MKKLLLAVLLLPVCISAQNSFRIFDAQNNDVTSQIVNIYDTSLTNIHTVFTVENIDVVPFDVTAGRIEIVIPPGTANAFSWALINYAPMTDTSAIADNLIPQETGNLVLDYFPNGNSATATINHCVWNRYDITNSSCMTVNYFPGTIGVSENSTTYNANVYPNPIQSGSSIQLQWDQVPGDFVTVRLIDLYGKVIEYRCSAVNGKFEVPTTDLAAGVYMLELSTENTVMMRKKLVVE